jgi:Tol biopolymer transport system component
VGDEELVLRSSRVIFPVDWSSDGRFIIFEDTSPETNTDLWALPLEGDRKPIALVQTRFAELGGQLRPDGQWLAYTSDESGRPEIYVRPFQAPGGGRSISTSGGTHPDWSSDGRELFYLSLERSLMSVPFDSNERTFQTGVPQELFNEPRIPADEDTGRPYVVSRDGQRFLFNTVLPEASSPIQVFVNWTPERKD